MITAIILAAGSAKRMGTQKLLLPFGNSTILECVMGLVKASELFQDIIVVYREAVVREAAEKLGLRAVLNVQSHLGLSTSVREGILNCEDDTDAYMFFSGDQPLITKELIKVLTKEFKKREKYIVVPTYNGNKGLPTIFPTEFKEALLSIEGDSGGRKIIEANREKVVFIEAAQEAAGLDIDTPEDYERALQIEILNKIE